MSALKRLAITALSAALLAPIPAWAQDIFVRPNAGSSTAPAVDYGVKARPQQQPAAPAAPKPVTPAPAPPIQAMPQQPAQPVIQVQPPTPAQQQALGKPQPVPQPGGGVEVQNLPNNVNVFKMPEEPPPGAGHGSGLFSINYKGGGLGAQDKSTLMRSLNLDEKEIQANCFFRYAALLTYAGGQTAYVNSGTASSFRYNFVPPLEKLSIFPTAACRKVRAPVSTLVVEQGGYYVNTFSPVECPLGNRGSSSIVVNFTYTGDGSGQCQQP